jgi:4-amino-4-deoxy-L-arabinose transferase-like glycosyltransferase
MRKNLKISDFLIDNNLSLLIFSVIYYVIIIFLSGYLNIWEDEVYSLNTSSGSLQYAFHQSIFFEAQPPAYFLLLTLWRFISDSILWARLFNLILIILSQFLLYQFAKDVVNRKIATISSILFLLNPTTVFTLLEIRLFAMVILLSLVIIIIFYNSYYNGKITSGRRILFILLAVTGLFTQYFIGFLLFANAVVLLIEKKKRSFWLYILDMIIPACLVLLYIPQILLSINVQTSIVPPHQKTFLFSLIEASSVFFDRTLQYTIPLNFSALKIWIFRGVFIILVFTSLNYVGIKKEIRNLLPFIVISLVIYLFFLCVHCMFGLHYSAYKYTTVVFVPLFISAILLFKLVKPGLLYYGLILLVLIYVTFNFKHYHELYKVNDYRSVGIYLEKKEKKGEPVFVYRNISAEIVNFYYDGINNVLPIPESFAYDKEFDPEQWEINKRDVSELSEKLVKYPSFYIIMDDTALKGFAESKKIIMDFLLNNFKLMEEKSFKEKITLYKFSDKIDGRN